MRRASRVRKPASTGKLFAARRNRPFFIPGNPSPIQAKLQIGAANDRFEQEADRVAAQVMRTGPGQGNAAPSIQRMETESAHALQRQPETGQEEEEVLQAKPQRNQSLPAGSSLGTQIHSAKGQGQPLPDTQRAFFEPRFGRRFDQVRIHTDGQSQQLAQRLQARAFTVGNDIVFNTNQYQPDSAAGRHLLAHELTHVVQQSTSRVRRVQRVPMVTSGEYGKALDWYLDVHVRDPVATRVANALRSSRTFMRMARFLDRKIIYPEGSGLDRFDDIRDDGYLVDERGRSIGKRGLYVYPSWHGTYFAVHGTPIPERIPEYDSINIEHARENAAQEEEVEHYASSIAHETKHAENVNARRQRRARREQTAITRGVREEAGVRATEQQVMREIRRAGRLAAAQTSANPSLSEQIAAIESGTARADVERSFVSQEPIKTYLEFFLFNFIKRRYRGNSSTEELREMMEALDNMPLDVSLLQQSYTLTDYGQAMGLHATANSAIRGNVEWATFYTLERLFGMEWEAFQEREFTGVADYFDTKEAILQRHLQILERTGSVSYSARIAHP